MNQRCSYLTIVFIVAGLGLGLAYIPSISVIGVYFDRRKPTGLGIAVSGVGLGTFVFPLVIRFLIE